MLALPSLQYIYPAITQRTLSPPTAPPPTVNMTAKTTRKTATSKIQSPDNKPEPTRKWLARHFLGVVLRQPNDTKEKAETWKELTLKRPKTAPPMGTAKVPDTLPAGLERSLTRPRNKPPPRPPRPDSDVIRDVNAWLDTSLQKPLMAGLPVWREGAFINPSDTGEIRYAVPIVKDAEVPAATRGQNLKSLCRRAKRMQVRMPSLLRTKSQRTAVQKQINRRSASTPLLSFPYESTPETDTSTFLLTRSRSLVPLLSQPAHATVATQTVESHRALLTTCGRRESSPSARFGASVCNIERIANIGYGNAAGDGMRPRTAGAHLSREASMGNLSDAPTYFSGLPPPSYRSRRASVLTTSSFGCMDGMNPEQREISQQRAQRRRGMKEAFKKLAQRAH